MSEYPPLEGWEQVAATSALEADVLQAALETAGIPAIQRGEAAAEIIGITVGRLGEVGLFVPGERAAEARELLSDAVAVDFPEGD